MSHSETTAVWIGNLRKTANEGHLSELFKGYNDYVVSIHIQRDKTTKESRGFAFVNFSCRLHAEDAVWKLDGKHFLGMRLKLDIKEASRSRKKSDSDGGRPDQLPLGAACASSESPKSPKYRPDPLLPAVLWIGSLHRNTTEKEIRELFTAYQGSISSVRIMRDAKDKRLSRGFGFINFTNGRHAEDALESLQGSLIRGLPVKLNIKKQDSSPIEETKLVPSQVSTAPVIRVIEKVSVRLT